MSKGIDTTQNCAPHIPALKVAGIQFVARYMSHAAWKNMTPAEVQALSAAGIYIVSVWESAGNKASFFTLPQGKMDAAAAVEFGHHIGQTDYSPIYFAVDYDARPNDVFDYFEGIRFVMPQSGSNQSLYKIGVYGSGDICKALKEGGYVSYTWLAQAMGWSGSRTYADWNIKQLPSGVCAGMAVDFDETRGDGGGWKLA